MTSIARHLLLPIAIVLCAPAASAHATLLVRSDGAGLVIQDKNGLNDHVSVIRRTVDGATGYGVINGNNGDIFKFDMQTGCRQEGFEAHCVRNGPKINVALLAGNDRLFLSEDTFALPASDSSAAGSSGDDELKGQVGKDFFDGGTGVDRLEGRGGNDILEGEDGNDVVIGGLGADTLRGDPGRDFINAKEPSGSGVADAIGCGGGVDFLEADLADTVPASCEDFEKSPVGETPHVRMPRSLQVSRSGRVRVRLRCPRGTRGIGCKGRLRLRVGRSSSRRVRYRIRAGRRKTVRLRLGAAAVRRVRARRTRGVLTSVERGRLGRKTTVRRPRLRAR